MVISVIIDYILLFFIYSFLGWLLEVAFTLVVLKKYINRGCLIGPYCPIYGFGCITLSLLLANFSNNLFISFVITLAFCSTLEYFSSWILEKIFKLRWWDYSRYKFNINGRICLETMLPFSIMGTLVIMYLNPIIISFLHNYPFSTLKIIAIILVIIITLDMLISIFFIIRIKKQTKISNRDATEEIKDNTFKMVVEKVEKVKKIKR